ncbi:MAG TPA: phosphatidate cytidylyltransferase, partial [Casimicrobiaceae bacterium]|nr:phosphatidate cytidylyltransferase [Casimicrobiaceae bacterium]
AILCILLVGSGTTRVLINRFPERDYTELRLRVRTWWFIVPPVAAALIAGKGVSIVLLAVLSALALKEYLAMVAHRGLDYRSLWFVHLAIPLQYWFAYRSSYVAFAATVPLFGLAMLPFMLLAMRNASAALRVAAIANLGLLLTVFSLSHIALLLELPDETNPVGGATGWVVFLLLLTQLNDVAQYVFGKCFGRRLIAPRASPNKTVEGFVGGIATSAMIAAWIGPLLTPFDAGTGSLVGAALAVAGFGGDMIVSALKREHGVKDAGNLLPGHGGILDRVDSLIATSPLFFYFVYCAYVFD